MWKKDLTPGDSAKHVIETVVNAAIPMVNRQLDESRKLTIGLEEADLATEVTIKVDYKHFVLIITATEGVDGTFVNVLERIESTDGIRSIAVKRFED